MRNLTGERQRKSKRDESKLAHGASFPSADVGAAPSALQRLVPAPVVESAGHGLQLSPEVLGSRARLGAVDGGLVLPDFDDGEMVQPGLFPHRIAAHVAGCLAALIA